MEEKRTVDVQKIMEEIKEQAVDISYREPVPFEHIIIGRHNVGAIEYSRDELREIQGEMCTCANNVLFIRRITGNPIVRLIKRIVCKMVLFLLEPMGREISAFNDAATNAVNMLGAFTDEQIRENEAKDKRIKELEQRIEKLETLLEKTSGSKE